MKPLLVIEPNLRKPSGHYAEYVRALATVAEGRTIEVMAHPEADAMLGAMPGVRVSTREPRVGRCCAEWRTIYRAVQEHAPFLVLTADGRHSLAVSLSSLATRRPPVNARLYFHWIPKGLRDSVLMKLSAPAREHALAIVPTEAIAASLRELGWKRVERVPYPMMGPVPAPEPVPFQRILVAGALRLNKGLDLVVGLSRLWEKQNRTTPLFVQTSMKRAKSYGKRETELVERLFSIGYRGLTTDDSSPGREEYVARFRGSLVLAPYERERFADAVSGVVLDALLHGAPVVATRGTWPGAVVERFGAGVTFEERTPESLSDAIDHVLDNWPEFSARACEAAVVLAREHDPRNLLDLL
jgi:glycosyltransferase involved in cell wall biosynthesis